MAKEKKTEPKEKGYTGNIRPVDMGEGAGPAVGTEGGWYALAFYQQSMPVSDADYAKFIKAVEKHVRGSEEYKRYLAYLKADLGLDRCVFVQVAEDEEVEVELHHAPLTLYDVCAVVLAEMHRLKEKVSSLTVARAVVKEHYAGRVGLVPVSKTAHEMIHHGKLLVAEDQIHGNWGEFMTLYGASVTSEMHEKALKLVPAGGADASPLRAGGDKEWGHKMKVDKLMPKHLKRED